MQLKVFLVVFLALELVSLGMDTISKGKSSGEHGESSCEFVAFFESVGGNFDLELRLQVLGAKVLHSLQNCAQDLVGVGNDTTSKT